MSDELKMMTEVEHEARRILKGATIRIVTKERDPDNRTGVRRRVKGQDTVVYLAGEDGTMIPLSSFASFTAVSWKVDSRSGYATAVLVADGVEVDVEGELVPDEGRALEIEHWKMRAEAAEKQLKVIHDDRGLEYP